MQVNYATPLLLVVAAFNMATIQVPQGKDPLYFWGTSFLVAMVIFGVAVFAYRAFTHRRAKVREYAWYGFGFTGVALLLTLAVATLPKPL